MGHVCLCHFHGESPLLGFTKWGLKFSIRSGCLGGRDQQCVLCASGMLTQIVKVYMHQPVIC